MTTEIKGFGVLPVQIGDPNILHYIYFKRHDVKGNSTSGNRSLFMCNLPVATSIPILKKYLSDVAIGATIELYTPSVLTDYPEDVWLNLTKLTSDLELTPANNHEESGATKLPKNCGVVTFVDKPAFQLAYNALKKLSGHSTVSKWPALAGGLDYYLSQIQQTVLDSAELLEQVSQALVDFDRAEKESYDALQKQTQLVDDDGFTLVVGTHRKTKAGILGKQKIAATVELNKAQSKMKKKEKEDFYRFQLRQKKKEEMNELLLKFKEDQEKVRLMKEKKRFKPY